MGIMVSCYPKSIILESFVSAAFLGAIWQTQTKGLVLLIGMFTEFSFVNSNMSKTDLPLPRPMWKLDLCVFMLYLLISTFYIPFNAAYLSGGVQWRYKSSTKDKTS